eukprot:Colp12_sorted_trinity150504_noHs@32595
MAEPEGHGEEHKRVIGGMGALSRMDVDWEEIDKPRFFGLSCVLFLGVRAMVYPASLVKTRLQVQAKGGRYTGTFNAFKTIIREEGIRGLYKGFGIMALGVMPAQLAYIGTYETVKQQTEALSRGRISGTLNEFIGGACASVGSQMILVPIDIVAQRLMLQSKAEARMTGTQIMRETLKKEGVVGLYRGFHLSILTYAPSSAIWWGSYGFWKRQLSSWHAESPVKLPGDSHVWVIQALAGMTAGLSSAVLTNPMDVIKTRTQTYEPQFPGDHLTLRRALGTLWQEEGPAFVFKGVTARMLNMAPVSILMISTYELIKRLAHKEPS